MCGRFTLFTELDRLAERFHLANVSDITYEPRYNIAPSQSVLAVIHDGEQNRAGMLRWGLIPSFAKDHKIGYKMINARAETIDEKPSFKRLLGKRRCLIIGDSFYEWRREDGQKIPVRIHLKDDQPFAMAGLWDRWFSPEGKEVTSCTIITTEPNSLMEPIHDRMPVILKEEDKHTWLDRSIDDKALLKDMLQPYDAEEMRAYEVSRIVNSPKNETSECIEPIEEVR